MAPRKRNKKFAADNAHIKIVQDNSKLVAKLIPQAIARALEKIGLLAEGHVIGYMTKEHIVDTGRLRNSITHAIVNDIGTVAASAVIGTNVKYGKYVHNGTSKVKARPFLTTPLQQHGSEYREILKDEMQNS